MARLLDDASDLVNIERSGALHRLTRAILSCFDMSSLGSMAPASAQLSRGCDPPPPKRSTTMVVLMSTAPSTAKSDDADYAHAHVERIQGQT